MSLRKTNSVNFGKQYLSWSLWSLLLFLNRVWWICHCFLTSRRGKLYFMYCGRSRIITGRRWLYSKYTSAQVCGRQVLISTQRKNINVCSHRAQTALNLLTCKCEKNIFVWVTNTQRNGKKPKPNNSFPSWIQRQNAEEVHSVNSVPLAPPLAKWYDSLNSMNCLNSYSGEEVRVKSTVLN